MKSERLRTPRVVKGKFNEEELQHIRELFRDLANRSPNNTISESDFEYLLGLPHFFAERLFRVFDTQRTGEINWDEFISGITKFTRGSKRERLEMLFEMWDLDGSAQVKRNELDLMIHQLVAPKTSGDQNCKETVDSIVKSTLLECDIDRSGSLSFDQFKLFIQRVPAFDDMVQNCLSRFIWTRDDSSRASQNMSSLHLPQEMSSSFSKLIVDDFGRQPSLEIFDFKSFDVAASQSEFKYCSKCQVEFWQNNAPPVVGKLKQVILKSGSNQIELRFCPTCGRKLKSGTAEAGLECLNLLAWSNMAKEQVSLERMEGPLWKKQSSFRRFVKRHYSLRNKFLYQFKKESSVHPDRAMFLQGYFLEEVQSNNWYGFRLSPPSESDLKAVELFSKDFQDVQKWVAGLRSACKTINIEDYYDIGEQIGYGAFSVVHRCTEKSTGDVYALKKMKKDRFDEESKKGLQNEIAIMKIVRHPGLVQLKDLYTTQQNIYMVMPLLKHGDLMSRLRERGKFSQEAARKTTKKLLSALDYLHSLGICHRDLKPENVFMGSENDDSDICLGDFGLSKFVAPHQHMSDACGTVSYAAPELLKGNTYDKKVDAWSVGCLLYLMLIGGLPFYTKDGDKATKDKLTMEKILNDEPSFRYIGWKEVSNQAIDLIKKFLEKDPKRRISVRGAMSHPWLKTCNITPLPSPIMLPANPSTIDTLDGEDEFSEVKPQVDGAGWLNSKKEPLLKSDVEKFQKLLGKSDYKVFPSLTGSLFECIGQFLDPSEDNPVEFCKEQLPPELQNSNTTKEDESLFNNVTDALQEFWLQLTVFKLISGTPKQIYKSTQGLRECRILYYNRNNPCSESGQNAFCILQPHSNSATTIYAKTDSKTAI